MSTLNAPRVIPFGKYKGLPFTELDTGYLRWMVQQVGGAIDRGPWKQYALDELKHRGIVPSHVQTVKTLSALERLKQIVTGLPTEETDPSKIGDGGKYSPFEDDPSIVWGEFYPGDQIASSQVSPLSLGPTARQFSVTYAAVGDASLLLLREFITRQDKKTGIVGWLKDLAEEAVKYGTPRESKDPPSTCFVYMKMVFEFSVNYQTSNTALMVQSYQLVGIERDQLVAV